MQPQCQSQLILEVVFVTILFVSYLYDYFRPLLHLLLTIKFRRIYQHIVTAEAKNIEFTQFAVDMSHWWKTFFLLESLASFAPGFNSLSFNCSTSSVLLSEWGNWILAVYLASSLEYHWPGQLTGAPSSNWQNVSPLHLLCWKNRENCENTKKINKCVSLLRLLSKF